MKRNYSNCCWTMHSGPGFSKFPTTFTMPGLLLLNNEQNTLVNSMRLICFQLTSQKRKPGSSWGTTHWDLVTALEVRLEWPTASFARTEEFPRMQNFSAKTRTVLGNLNSWSPSLRHLIKRRIKESADSAFTSCPARYSGHPTKTVPRSGLPKSSSTDTLQSSSEPKGTVYKKFGSPSIPILQLSSHPRPLWDPQFSESFTSCQPSRNSCPQISSTWSSKDWFTEPCSTSPPIKNIQVAFKKQQGLHLTSWVSDLTDLGQIQALVLFKAPLMILISN